MEEGAHGDIIAPEEPQYSSYRSQSSLALSTLGRPNWYSTADVWVCAHSPFENTQVSSATGFSCQPCVCVCSADTLITSFVGYVMHSAVFFLFFYSVS